MASKDYIGTTSPKKAAGGGSISKHTVIQEEIEPQHQWLKPIQRDPILVRNYREAIKSLPQRGKVDHTRIISRVHRKSKNSRVPDHHGVKQSSTLDDFYNRPRTETLEDHEEETEVQSMSQTTYVATCKHLGVIQTASIFTGLAQDSLKLKYHILGEQAIKAACVALISNTVVSTVDLTGAGAGAKGATYIADVLRENLYIMDLTIAENNIGTQGLAAICDALKENRTLQYLNLSDNNLKETDGSHIKDMLSENTTLKGLNISCNKFRDEGGVLLGEGLECNDSVQDIDFSWNHLRQKGALKIMKSLLVNNTVKRADFSFNGFHDAADQLAEVLESNTTLTYLDFTSNRLTDKDMAKFVKGFSKNENLETLLVGKNPFTAPYSYQILEIVCENPANQIKELDLEGQSVDVQFLELIQKTREQRQLYINHGTVLKASLRKKATDDFESNDPMMVLMECMTQRQIALVDLFQKIDKDDSKTITKTELREGLHSLNIPMSSKAIDKLMKKLDIDDNGEIDFAEFMEGQREYLRVKDELEKQSEEKKEKNVREAFKLRNKVTNLVKRRRLAKMALVLDTSTEQMKKVIQMNKVKLVRPEGLGEDNSSMAMERIAKARLSLTMLPSTPPKSPKTPGSLNSSMRNFKDLS